MGCQSPSLGSRAHSVAEVPQGYLIHQTIRQPTFLLRRGFHERYSRPRECFRLAAGLYRGNPVVICGRGRHRHAHLRRCAPHGRPSAPAHPPSGLSGLAGVFFRRAAVEPQPSAGGSSAQAGGQQAHVGGGFSSGGARTGLSCQAERCRPADRAGAVRAGLPSRGGINLAGVLFPQNEGH